jgi:hypothetical protein
LTLLLDSLQKVADPEVLRAAAKMLERECSSD